MFSVYWPRPFSAKRDERRPGKAEARYNGCQGKQLNDLFDPLSTFKISKYKRCDNAFSGVGREHFGCLGESKFAQSYFNAPGDSGLHFPTGLEPIPAQYAPTPAEPVSYRYPESYNQRPPAYQARYQEPAEEDQSMLDKWGNSIKSLMRR